MTIDGTPSAPTGEDKQWAHLAAEVEIELPEEEEPATEALAEPEGEVEVEQPKTQPIPYEELESRHRQTSAALKETREREQSARDQLKAFTGMVEQLRSQRQQPAEAKPAEVEIDPNEDPIAYFQNEIAKLQGQLAETTKSATETREEARSRQEYSQFMGQVSQHEAEFASRTPDYHQAAEFLEKGRRAELAILFPDGPQMNAYARQQGFETAAALREAVFVNDAQTVARNALMAGMNPAEAYYGLAKGRGYSPGAGGGGDKLAKANGVIDATRRGMKASKSLSGGGGQADNPLNVADLTDLYAEDPEEFDRQWAKLEKAGKLG